VLDSATLRDVWRHLLRWSRTYRAQRPISWFFTVVTHATLWGTIAPIVTGGSAAGWTAFVGAVGARLVSLANILRLLRDPDTPRRLWLVPLKDLGSSLMWAAAFLGRRVNWSGRVLRVMRDGRMVQVSPAPALAPVEAENLRAAGS
jgi:ceramide glucosyltransferase